MSFDYLIVGNAILGLTTAYRLTQLQPNASIGIVGPVTRPNSATTAAGAMLGLFGEVKAAHDADKYDKEYFKLAYHAQTLWPDFVEELNSQLGPKETIQIHPNGTFILHNTQSTTQNNAPNYQAILQALRDHNEPHTEVIPEEIPGLCPKERERTLGGVYIPNERSIEPATVLTALEQILRKNPQIIAIDATVTQLRTTQKNDDCIKGVVLDDGTVLSANQVILAAGAETQAIIETLPVLKGRTPQIMAGDGVSFVLDQAPLSEHNIEHVIRTPNRAGARGLHVIPNVKNTNLLYLGAGNKLRWRPVPGASMESAAWLMQSSFNEISQHLTQARLHKFNQGNRPTSFDGYPLLGASTSVAGLWFLTGTGRDGFQRAPLLSGHIAKKLTGTIDLSAAEKHTLAIFETFTPERLPLQTYDQATSIQPIAQELNAALHENADLLPGGIDTDYSESLSRDIHDIYEKLETDLAIPALIMLSIIHRRLSINDVKTYLEATKQAWN